MFLDTYQIFTFCERINLKRKFSLLTDITSSEDEIVSEFTEEIVSQIRGKIANQVLKQVRKSRDDFLELMRNESPGCMTFHDRPEVPMTKGGRQKNYDQVIENAEKAHKVFVLMANGGTISSTAVDVFSYETSSDKAAKNFERRIRQLIRHAGILLEAVKKGPEFFFQALPIPLSKSS